MKQWKIGDKHKYYGEVIAMGIREGEPYRFFKNKDGTISLIPLACLLEETVKIQEIFIPKNKSTFKLSKDSNLRFDLTCERPNWFNRVMQRIFFGFHWEKV